MADWEPELYRRFEAERTRPAEDLLAGVKADPCDEVVDLGCGPGNSTELLLSRFPRARLTGVDNSDAMLATASQRLPRIGFAKGDVAHWTPDRTPDLIFANAVLQWVPDHATIIPRLFGLLACGGVLAVQMPDNFDEPTHRLMHEVGQMDRWKDKIGEADRLRGKSVLALSAYYDLLARQGVEVDVWRTVYHHPMVSVAAIVDWLRSTGLRRFLAPLTAAERTAFLEAYEQALMPYYQPRANGRILLEFPRVFIVAQRIA